MPLKNGIISNVYSLKKDAKIISLRDCKRSAMIGKLHQNHYRINDFLGGGFSKTYIAEDTHIPGNPKCVIKHLEFAKTDPDFLPIARRLVINAAETLEELGNHDQIPRLLAYFEENQEFYLVQEFVEGNPFSTMLSSGVKWTEAKVIHLLKEVLSILEFVHQHGVIHCDIKPENLIRRHKDGKLVLLDFGVIEQIQQDFQNQTHPTSIPVSTSRYRPFEQEIGKPHPNSDIYALGMIGIQALTGLHPTELQKDDRSGEIIWRSDAPEVNDGLAAVLSKMVRYHFRERYQSATEVLEALQSLTNPYQESIQAEAKPEVRKAHQFAPPEQILGGNLTAQKNVVYRFALRNGANPKERRVFKQSIEVLKQANPQWSVDHDWTQPGEDEAITLTYRDKEYLSRRVAYLASAAFSKTVQGNYDG
jgi:serine/threonine protein kinase